jgi:hypothetical protein
MNRKFQAALVSAAALTCLAGSASAANIVMNGNFEGGTYSGPNGDVVPNWWTVGPPAFTSQSDVNVETATNPAIDLGPESGSAYMAFQSPATDGRDCLWEDLNTVAGQVYDISFWVAITSTSVGNNIGLDVQWDENTANQTDLANAFYESPSNTGPAGYQEFSFVETASTNTTRIDFHGVDTDGAILLDNVVVTQDAAAAPEPVSLMLAGLGLLALGLTRLAGRARV